MIPRFAFNFIDSFPNRLFFARGIRVRYRDFYFQPIHRPAKSDAAGCIRGMASKTVLASGNHGSLKLKNRFIPQPRGIRHIPGSTADRGNQPFISIH